jgi:hypothetical protein
VTGDLYAATDFGVMTLPNGATSWTSTGGLPMAEGRRARGVSDGRAAVRGPPVQRE